MGSVADARERSEGDLGKKSRPDAIRKVFRKHCCPLRCRLVLYINVRARQMARGTDG